MHKPSEVRMHLNQASIVQALLKLFKNHKNHCTHHQTTVVVVLIIAILIDSRS